MANMNVCQYHTGYYNSGTRRHKKRKPRARRPRLSNKAALEAMRVASISPPEHSNTYNDQDTYNYKSVEILISTEAHDSPRQDDDVQLEQLDCFGTDCMEELTGNYTDSIIYDNYDMMLYQLESYEQNKTHLQDERDAYWKYFCHKEIWILVSFILIAILVVYSTIKYVFGIELRNDWSVYAVAIVLCVFISWLLHLFLVYRYDRIQYGRMYEWNRLRFEEKIKKCVYYWYGSSVIPDDVANCVVQYIGSERLKRNDSLIQRMYRRDTSKRSVYLCFCCCS
eukprot:15245_1